jgi:hypothetical protein
MGLGGLWRGLVTVGTPAIGGIFDWDLGGLFE